MCARYSIALSSQALQEHFGIESDEELLPRYNVAPTQVVPAVVLDAESHRRLKHFKWGLVPYWSKDATGGTKMLNARSETAFEKPAFRHAIRKNRCLLPATGFFEWREENGRKQPYHIRLKSRHPFALAGLYERWRSPEGEELQTCTILTTESNEALQELHDRMPVILAESDYEAWLSPLAEPADLVPLLTPFPSEEIESFRVTPRMSRAIYEEPDSIEPLVNGAESTGGLFA